MLSVCQHTVERSAQWRGERRRRRADKLTVHPADADTGIRFVLPESASPSLTIPARWDAVSDTRSGVALGDFRQKALRGAIPLLAALRVAGVDNAVVEVQGPTIPAEVSDFCFYLETLGEIGVHAQGSARRLLCVVDAVEVRDRFGFVTLSPATKFSASVSADGIETGGFSCAARAVVASNFTEPHTAFSVSLIESDKGSIHPPDDINNVAWALQDICGLPPVLQAAVVELIGHLFLAGAPLAGHIRARGAGPSLYQTLLKTMMERRTAALTTVDKHRAQLCSLRAGADESGGPVCS